MKTVIAWNSRDFMHKLDAQMERLGDVGSFVGFQDWMQETSSRLAEDSWLPFSHGLCTTITTCLSAALDMESFWRFHRDLEKARDGLVEVVDAFERNELRYVAGYEQACHMLCAKKEEVRVHLDDGLLNHLASINKIEAKKHFCWLFLSQAPMCEDTWERPGETATETAEEETIEIAG